MAGSSKDQEGHARKRKRVARDNGDEEKKWRGILHGLIAKDDKRGAIDFLEQYISRPNSFPPSTHSAGMEMADAICCLQNLHQAIGSDDIPGRPNPCRPGRAATTVKATSRVLPESAEEAKAESLTPTTNHATVDTSHVLVLYCLPKGTRTTELEKIFDEYKDAGVAIRWVNDTTAIAVFSNPSLADSAISCIPIRYHFRRLRSDEELVIKLNNGELEPPHQKPTPSAGAGAGVAGRNVEGTDDACLHRL